MFDRFIRLARARKALREARFFDALQQACDPLIEADRRADEIRSQATERLVANARRRLEQGDVPAAQAQAKRIAQLTSSGGASREVVDELLRSVEQAAGSREKADRAARERRAEFRKFVESGDLQAAEALVATLDEGEQQAAAPAASEAGGEGSAAERMQRHLSGRRDEAQAALGRAAEAAQQGDATLAVESYQRALSIDRQPAETLRKATLPRIGKAVAAAVQMDGPIAGLGAEELGAPLALWLKYRSQLPELAETPAGRDVEQLFVAGVDRALRKPASLLQASALAQRVVHASLPFGPLDAVLGPLAALAEGAAGNKACATTQGELHEAALAAGLAKLARLANAQLVRLAKGDKQLDTARELSDQGQLDAARTMLVTFLETSPLHERAQSELELVDESLAALDRRLANLRLALRAGRLRETCTEALALTGSARIAGEAQEILGEARNRMALVDKGLDEVRVALHGRAAATREGVRHLLKRLEELQKVQVDHAELPALIESVQAEIAALEQCERIVQAIARDDLPAVEKHLPELMSLRPALLSSERIDGRLCEMGDRIASLGDHALEEGRLVVTQRCGALLEQFAVVREDFATRRDEWLHEQRSREGRVEKLLAEAREHLAERDLATAEQCVDGARALWREAAEVQSFGHRLAKLRKHSHMLEEVAAMTDDKDFLGAQEKLSTISEVPKLLRTRVYDIKQNLARAQGLEGAFLLRVDEGGEQLVMRGESVSVGNVQKSRADLPVLANLAGRHASIRRSMSFHGGMQDTVVAEDGDVRIDGRKVDKQALQSGQKVQFGPALKMLYQRPTARSLTSRLTLQSGFQVAGTDRVLLMKDRGRDGRILLGPGRDVHVSVASATGEVEVFAGTDGAIKVFCEHGGTIDGQVFKGEHPVGAGQVVEAAGITFLMLPWQPAA
ncbi:MAG: hypothetical protein AB8H80_21380 [Planctomycetota bacterium]